jgi:hypothetical protein
MRFALLVNNQLAMRGDGSSVAIIYNNLIDVNTPYGDSSEEGLASYRRFMGEELFSNQNTFQPGTEVSLVALPTCVLVSYRIGDPNPVRGTSEIVGEETGGFAHLGKNYPQSIATRYSAKDPVPAHGGRIEDYHYNGPPIKTIVRASAVQHFCVYAEPGHQLLLEFQSTRGREAFDNAVLFAEQRGLPWQVSGAAEIFDPTTGQLWSL